MAGNVQMIIDGKHRRPRAVLLVTALVILVTGCGKKSGLEHAYSYDDPVPSALRQRMEMAGLPALPLDWPCQKKETTALERERRLFRPGLPEF